MLIGSMRVQHETGGGDVVVLKWHLRGSDRADIIHAQEEGSSDFELSPMCFGGGAEWNANINTG